MRVVFLGTPALGRTVLEKLVSSGIEVPLVITQPDRSRQKRGKGAAEPSEVGAWAEQNGLTVLKPEKVALVEAEIEAANPDAIVVAAYGQIIPDAVLKTAGGKWINVHGSLLPEYRGASPVQQAILDGLPETGVTIMEVVSDLDAGSIISQKTVPIGDTDTAGDLMKKISRTGAQLLVTTLPEYLKGSIEPKPQQSVDATMTSTLTKADGQIDWTRDSKYLERFVRAMQPWPGAWTEFEGQSLVILETKTASAPDGSEPGTFENGSPLTVATGDGAIIIAKLKPAGKSAMSGEAWLRGLRRGGRFTSR